MIIAQLLILLGVFLMLLASIGVLRFPDVFSRMHAGTKSASLGLACVLTGTAMVLGTGISSAKLFIAIAFQFMTAPVAAHVIGRAAYRAGISMFEQTHRDDLGGRVGGAGAAGTSADEPGSAAADRDLDQIVTRG